MTKKTLIFTIIATTLGFASPAFAQFDFEMTGSKPDLTMTMTPLHPAPGESVQFQLTSHFLDLSGSTIVWYVNGRNVTAGIGADTFTTTSGSYGTDTNVTAMAANPQGASASATADLIPTQVDLMYDSDSYVPPFYDGLALPSSGAIIHVEAIPYFVTPVGKRLDATALIYTWKRDGRILKDISGKGKSSISLVAPLLQDTTNVTVDVASSDGSITGTASVNIPTVSPVVDLYQDHPLFGIQYFSAIKTPAYIPDTEMAFAVVPYFTPAHSLLDPSLVYNWKVNNMDIPINASAPNRITIDASKSTGSAFIDVAINYVTNFFVDATRSWGIQFSTSGNTPTTDVFHNPTQ